MTATIALDQQAPAKRDLKPITGRVLSGLAIAFLLMDAGMKLIAPQFAIDNSPPLGWPADPNIYRALGLILLAATLLYAFPATALFGAVLLTAYLGGAVATHARVASPLFTHTLFGVYLGLMVWGGLWLRDPSLRALLPLRSKSHAR